MKQIGITADRIKELEEASKTLRQKDEEMDALRQEVTQKSRENHELLAELKEQILFFRKTVKRRYEQPEWINFGVQDKR